MVEFCVSLKCNSRPVKKNIKKGQEKNIKKRSRQTIPDTKSLTL